MKLTLLLDLDDTLLKNNFDEFLPYYLESYSKAVSPIIEPSNFVIALMESTRAMIANRQPDCTLKEVFESSFYPLMNISKDKFQIIAESFYLEEFPKLRIHTKSIPEAKVLVQTAQEKGYSISISTNPLFPRVEIEERLKWANLSQNDFQYEIISCFESFHFAKPDPAYFAELLAQIGWPQGPVLAVGDDIESDIFAANQLGLKTFWVNPGDDNGSSMLVSATAQGSLADLVDWIGRTPFEQLMPDYSSAESILATLRSTPAALDSARRTLPHSMWTFHPQYGEWGITEVMCHLRDVDVEVNLPRVRQILIETNPFLSGKDTDQWADERNYSEQDSGSALEEFITARMDLVTTLENLESGDWERPSRHAIFGPTNLKELMSITASHDRMHLNQIQQIIQAI